MALDDFGRTYLKTMLEINKHTEGFVDAYIGPEEIKADVDANELVDVSILDDQLEQLLSAVPDDEPQRKSYLTALLHAAQTALHLNPEQSEDYVAEVRTLYGIDPELVSDNTFVEVHQQLEAIMPGTGDIADRSKAYRDHYQIPDDKVATVLEVALTEVRKRTSAFIDLVEGESFTHELVSDVHWGAYNWYKGNARSLIQFNTDIPLNALGILDICAHEGYPGHHTEGMLKEKHLYQEQGIAESAIQLLLSPSAIIAEGIAMTALEMIFPDGTHRDWEDEVLFPLAGIEPHSADLRKAISEASKQLRYVVRNAAYLHHTGQLDEADTITYLQDNANVDEQRAKQSLRFITHPLSRAYIFSYTVGYDLIDSATSDDKRPLFKRLLTENILPEQIATLI